MTVQNKVIFSNVIIAILVTGALAFNTDTFPGNGFFLMLGAIGFAGGLGCLGLGLLLLLRKYKQAARGYIISAGVLLAIGLVSYFLLRQY